MSTTGELIGMHAFLAVWVAFCSAMIWGRLPESIYGARATSPWIVRWFLMCGELMKDRDGCLRFMRRLAWFQLVVGLAVYILLLLWVLLHH